MPIAKLKASAILRQRASHFLREALLAFVLCKCQASSHFENVSFGEHYVEDWSQMVQFFMDIPYDNLPGFDTINHFHFSFLSFSVFEVFRKQYWGKKSALSFSIASWIDFECWQMLTQVFSQYSSIGFPYVKYSLPDFTPPPSTNPFSFSLATVVGQMT